MEQQRVKLRAALIGDVIGSRQAEDREGLQIGLRQALAAVNDVVEAPQPLTITIGDEFQGAYRKLGEALDAALRLQLTMRSTGDIRVGIGWGELFFGEDAGPLDQDGPCWWRARQAIDSVKTASNRGPRSRRSAVVTETELDPLLSAYVGLRDEVVSGIDAIDATIALRLIAGASQTEVADELGINKSSVSRRVHGHGVMALVVSIPETLRLPEAT